MEGSFRLNPNVSPSIPGFLSSFAVADKAQKNQDKAPENQAESCSKGNTSGDTFDPLKSEENDMDPVAIANMVFSMFPNVSTDIIDELLKANDFDINLTVDMLDELSSQYTLHDDAEDINDLHDGQGDNYHHAKVSESSSNPNQDLQNEKSSAGRACFLLDQQMNPPTELGARSLFDGMPQSASVAGGDDLISALPDVLLHHVLGFLDAREAVRTCVIAKRWCHLWKSISVVRVTCDGSVQLHHKFLDHLLLLHDRTNLEVCLFDFDHYTIADVPYFDLLIQHALLCQVWELSLSVFDDDRLDAEELWMQNVHLTSQYLTKLKLDGLCLPNKFLDFSSCPALRDLNMIDCDIRADKIYSRSLEHLSMDGCVFRFDCGTLISTPSVISLQLNECLGKAVLFEDMPVLVRATVTLIIWCFDYCESDDPGYCDNASCWRCYSTDDGRAGCVFLKGLSAARTLELIAEPKVFIFGRDLR